MTMDLHRARRFIEAVPEGSWTAYKDVATAAGNSNGAMAIGTWLRNSGGAIKNYWRVLNVKGSFPTPLSVVAPVLSMQSQRGISFGERASGLTRRAAPANPSGTSTRIGSVSTVTEAAARF